MGLVALVLTFFFGVLVGVALGFVLCSTALGWLAENRPQDFEDIVTKCRRKAKP